MKYIDVLKALADYNRLAIMCYLRNGTRCVCEIEQILSISQSATSKHLNRLRIIGLIDAEKKAQWVHYSIPIRVYMEYPFLEKLLSDASMQYVFDPSKVKKPSDC
ncbi:ArsR/SmtB family transcription factor [Pelosinus propionicus]|uniref:Transcriptional regulator, ArsR family n=1 Tax=Pelosinus propionicus DSM 13327 TaxID=1123291 RepID=A0A1I4QK27_9FIRM|nr:metalloregulator ArsR/SmtB family transcription factor [Pelosinus propionicus]SFM40020.1 transcriptional regulator, ArsR family [Pelosinus propionicus DSM 13327]